MISYLATADDVGRVRFGSSPLAEAVFSIRMLGRPSDRHAHRPWVDEIRPRLARADLRLLRALIPPTGYIPDFLTPPLPAGSADLRAHLEVVRATEVEELVGEVTVLTQDEGKPPAWRAAAVPYHRWILDHPERAAAVIVGQLATYWELALEPHWARIQRWDHRDVRNRMRVLETAGVAAMFSTLHPQISWQENRLSVDGCHEFEASLGGQGLVLTPSVLCGPRVLNVLPPLQPMIVYPLPSVGLWTERDETASPLAALLGGVRAQVLEALLQDRSTSELADRVGVTPGAVSQHIGVLRDCGLVESTRHGRRVLHSLTATGEELLRSAGRARGGLCAG